MHFCHIHVRVWDMGHCNNIAVLGKVHKSHRKVLLIWFISGTYTCAETGSPQLHSHTSMHTIVMFIERQIWCIKVLFTHVLDMVQQWYSHMFEMVDHSGTHEC